MKILEISEIYQKVVKMDKNRKNDLVQILGYLYEIYTFDPLFWGSWTVKNEGENGLNWT